VDEADCQNGDYGGRLRSARTPRRPCDSGDSGSATPCTAQGSLMVDGHAVSDSRVDIL